MLKCVSAFFEKSGLICSFRSAFQNCIRWNMKFDTFSTDFLSMVSLSITSQAPPAQWSQIHCEFAIKRLPYARHYEPQLAYFLPPYSLLFILQSGHAVVRQWPHSGHNIDTTSRASSNLSLGVTYSPLLHVWYAWVYSSKYIHVRGHPPYILFSAMV